MFRFIVPAILAVLLSACSTTGGQPSNATTELLVQYATLKVIANNPERAQRVVTIAQQALDQLSDPTASVTVALIENAVRSQIHWEKLDPADTLLANALISMVHDELVARVGDGLLPADKLVQVKAVLEWVVAAGALVPPAPAS